jgi:methyl-accepting chemotaxis protein
MLLANLKIRTRLALLAMLLIVGILAVAGQAWYSLNESSRQAGQALREQAQIRSAVDHARLAQVQLKIQIQELKNLLLRGRNPDRFEHYRKAFIGEGESLQKTLKDLRVLESALGMDVKAIDELAVALTQMQTQYVEALRTYDPAAADPSAVVDALVRGLDRAPTESMDKLVGSINARAVQSANAALTRLQSGEHQALASIAVALLLALAAGGATAWWLARSVVRPLGEAVVAAQAVAAGDLSRQIVARSRDETGQLTQALADMNASLKNIVQQVHDASASFYTGTAELAQGNLDLSTRTEEQAASIEETASSMEQMNASVRNSAARAQEARSMADAAASDARRSSEIVREAVQSMEQMDASARKIVDIIGVIDGIAFQTNILALNAAVEAARAGEQGRGFAVVAAEVRNLAQRSARSAQEIKQLIDTSVSQAASGTALVTKAGAAMEAVVQGIDQVAGRMNEISMAAEEQSHGIDQVNQAVSQMDQITQQNAALVEQAAAASKSLEQQSQTLLQAVSAFKLAA